MLKDNQFLKIRTGSPDPLDPEHQRMTFQLTEIVGQSYFQSQVVMWAHAFRAAAGGPEWLLFMVMLDLQQQMHWAIYKHFNIQQEGQSG